jgi:hypothetical protein
MIEIPLERAQQARNLLERAWGIIANAGWDAGSGQVDLAKTTGWHEAALRWRGDYFRWSTRDDPATPDDPA